MHRHLRVVGARLDAEVAVERSGVEVVADERRQALEPAGRWSASPKRSSKSDGPKPNVMVRLLAGSPSASRCRPAALRASRRRHRSRAHLEALHHPRRRIRPVREEGGDVLAGGPRHHVVRREVQVLLHGGGDAGLMDAGCRGHGIHRLSRLRLARRPRHRRVPRPRRRRGSWHSRRWRGRSGRADTPAACRPPGRRIPLRVLPRHRHSRTVTVSCESGSARALMRSVS